MTDKNTVTERVRSELLGEEYTLIHHKSGLDIYVVEKDFSSAYAIFGTRYGSNDNCFKLKGEAENVCVPEGIAHFLEHKMFEMEDGSDAFEAFAQVGADANAYTGGTRTAYLFSCTKDFGYSLRTLLGMVTKPYFTERTVEKERGIIAEEIKMCEDRPGDALYYGLLRAVFEKHPVRIPVAGTVESISEITPELLYRCYNTFYNLRNMALCICGNVDIGEIISIADEMLTEAPAFEIERFVPKESENVFKARESVRMQVSKPMFRIGVKDLSPYEGGHLHGETVRALLCEALFGAGGELFNELYEEGLVGGYDAYFATGKSASMLTVSGDADDPEAVFERFVAYASKCAENGVTDEQFIRARRVLYAQLVQSFDSSADIAEGLFSAFVSDLRLFDSADEIYRVTKEEIDGLAKKLFVPSRYAMSTVYPAE